MYIINTITKCHNKIKANLNMISRKTIHFMVLLLHMLFICDNPKEISNRLLSGISCGVKLNV